MRQLGPLLLMVVGVVVASAFGARNGDHHVRYRRANAIVEHLEGLRVRLEACGDRGGVDAEAACRAEVREEARASGLVEDGDSLASAIERTRGERDRIGLPAPGLRWAEWARRSAPGWGVGLVLIALGALLARRQRSVSEEAPGHGGGSSDLGVAVDGLLEQLVSLQEAVGVLGDGADAPELRERVDRLLSDRVGPVVEGRERLIARHGIGRFAEYFGPFSAGERNLGRTWSALTDGHPAVAHEAIGAALSAFGQARAAWDRVEGR